MTSDYDPPKNARKAKPGWYYAKSRITGETMIVHDMGPTFVPRYWANGEGYTTAQLDFAVQVSPPKTVQHPDNLLQLL
ncbi:MAG: hypothetical protein JRN62_03130 [Nitrososphaerota archaeon]|jgi:hypothetical protein|nr:hypothetical protein [Nitrososphaerota archaeon]MDG6948590.1 hypothetical protein [Nitrososphaerota archaeon]